MTLESSLIKQAKGGLFLCDISRLENLVDFLIKSAFIDFIVARRITRRLRSSELPEQLYLRPLMVAEVKVLHPFSFAFNDYFCRPNIAKLFLLRDHKAINDCAMMRG